MYAKSKFTESLNKLGNYTVNLVTHRDPRGRKYYSGFISNPVNGKVVYMTTESYYNAHCENKFMVRLAKYKGDYSSSSINHFAEPNNTAMLVHTLLRDSTRKSDAFLEDTIDLTGTIEDLERMVAHWDE